MTIAAILVLLICGALKTYIIHNCPSHPLYRQSDLFTRARRPR